MGGGKVSMWGMELCHLFDLLLDLRLYPSRAGVVFRCVSECTLCSRDDLKRGVLKFEGREAGEAGEACLLGDVEGLGS